MSISVQCPGCEKKLKTKDELAGKRVKCPGCGQVILVPAAQPASQPKAINQLPPPIKEPEPPPEPQARQPSSAVQHGAAAGTAPPPIDATPRLSTLGEAAGAGAISGSVAGLIPPKKILSDSIITVLAISCACVAVVFVITFLAGALTAFLIPIVKSLQGEGNKSLFQIAAFAILGILFIASFLVFNLVPLLVTTAACTNAKDQLRDGSSRTKRVVVVLALALLSSVLLWVFLPWLQYVPYRTADWSESTLTIYRWTYVGLNLVVGVIMAAQTGSPRKQPAAPQAAPKPDGV
jgi:DNA-directed RNA polymerase subunit RPC12/RpoP